MKLLRTVHWLGLNLLKSVYNFLLARRSRPPGPVSDLPAMAAVAARARVRTDVSDHLETLFAEALLQRPRVIVELGTRGGESTFVLSQAAAGCGADLISVDLEDCSGSSAYPRWHFVKSDDVAFAKKFPGWCRRRNITPRIGLLFIDTSHEFEHTRREIQAWFPHLAPGAKVIFHDTHLRLIYFRRDRSMGIGWNNRRGVMRALEEYFSCRFDESRTFVDARRGWLIRHWPDCNGLTILDRQAGRARR